jgi:hypothetical protein
MIRLILPYLIIFLQFCFSPVSFAAPAPMPDADTLSKQCYAAVGPLLRSSDGKLTPSVRSAYLNWTEKTVLQELSQSGQTPPADCIEEIQKDDMLHDAIYGSVFPPDPSILQNYSQIRVDLGKGFVSKYRSLIVAVSLSKRVKGVENADQIKSIGRDYQPGFWTDESLQVPGSDTDKQFVRRIADFMKQTHASALDLYQSESMQNQLKEFLSRHSIGSDLIGQVKKSVQFGERLKYAMVLLGQRPGARDPKPATDDWLRYLVAINASRPSSTPTVDGKTLQWPLFPLQTAPWPLLMPFAHPVPLSEADYIWETFQGEHGSDRYHTYGPYRDDDDAMPDSLRPSRWFWDAWPDRIIHGGECVPISKGTVELYSSLGKPAMWAGQPGHANLITFQFVNGKWTAEIEQAFAGGPDVTSAQWYFDEDPGSMLHFRDLYYWPGAEYQLGLALAMNVGLDSYMDTRIASNIFKCLPPEDKHALGVNLLRSALIANPFNPDTWYRLAEQAPDAPQALTLIIASRRRDAGFAANHPGDIFPVDQGDAAASDQYWKTVGQFVTQYCASSIMEHSSSQAENNLRLVYYSLMTAPNARGDDLAAYAEKIEHGNSEGSNAQCLQYDQYLASHGDFYGELRMGQRYRDGVGVAADNAKAQSYLVAAALQGDLGASSLLGSMYPYVPANMITVAASSEHSRDQAVEHLVDGSGLTGIVHDNAYDAKTMWHTTDIPTRVAPPASGLPVSPAWVRFDFAQPIKFQSILIWNHNQTDLTNRGFRCASIYSSADGSKWTSITTPNPIVLPAGNASLYEMPTVVANNAPEQPIKSVIIAASISNGNYGGSCYGLSAVHFVVAGLPRVIPANDITVTASTVYSSVQDPRHLIDGSGMFGDMHDNAHDASTMWHSVQHPDSKSPAQGLPASPAWVRFDFSRPERFASILIWNHNQQDLTDRGFRKTRIYGTTDGVVWRPLTTSETIELPRANGGPMAEPASIPNSLASDTFKSVIIAADSTDGNYGSDNYGLSAIRFVEAH